MGINGRPPICPGCGLRSDNAPEDCDFFWCLDCLNAKIRKLRESNDAEH
jgi:hypothetical protein